MTTSDIFDPAISDHILEYAALDVRRKTLSFHLRDCVTTRTKTKKDLKNSLEMTPWCVTSVFDDVEDAIYTFSFCLKIL